MEKSKNYSKPSVTADILIFALKDKALNVLLVKRKIEPFKGMWAIPGGFVRLDESLENAAKRELEEETGVKADYLEQLYTFGDVNRDPRGRVITVCYFALIRSDNIKLKARTDVSDARWFPVGEIKNIAFDHKKILGYGLKRLKWKFEYTTIAFSILPKKFTLAELREVYEIIFSKRFDNRNFRKKIFSLKLLKEEGIKKEVSHRPPMLYSPNKSIGEIVEILKPGE